MDVCTNRNNDIVQVLAYQPTCRRLVFCSRTLILYFDFIADSFANYSKRINFALAKHSGCSTVGSAPRSGRGGRKFESSHPDSKRTIVTGCLFLFNLHKTALINSNAIIKWLSRKIRKDYFLKQTDSNIGNTVALHLYDFAIIQPSCNTATPLIAPTYP